MEKRYPITSLVHLIGFALIALAIFLAKHFAPNLLGWIGIAVMCLIGIGLFITQEVKI